MGAEAEHVDPKHLDVAVTGTAVDDRQSDRRSSAVGEYAMPQ